MPPQEGQGLTEFIGQRLSLGAHATSLVFVVSLKIEL